MEEGTKIIVDDLTLIKLLDKGSFGEVYLTKKKGRSEFFATKKMDRKVADRPDISKYLKTEITILKELKNHKNIVKLEDAKVTDHNYYIVMEFCNGGSLSDCLKKYQKKTGKPFTQEIVQYLMKQIINVMKYVHSRGIIHRDLKLDNILVNFDSELDKNNLNMMKATIKIIDFGFSTYMSKSNLASTAVGSPLNMDPTILKKLSDGKQGINNSNIGYDQKADIWSLGTLCYEMLIGESAFNAESLQELVNKVQNGSYKIPTSLSKEVVSFLNSMLQFDSQKRLSCEELSRHHFLTKRVKDFQPIDLRKVSNKVQGDKLNINVKKNSTIWSIFNADDENKLINIPGNFLASKQEVDECNYHRQNSQKTNNNKMPMDTIRKPIKKMNTANYQGYGMDIGGINAYPKINNNNNINNNIYNYGNNQPQQFPPNFQNNQIPNNNLNNFENNMVNNGPIPQDTSFGVPSPGEQNSETAYHCSGGIFTPNLPKFQGIGSGSGYSSGSGGYVFA